MPQLSRTAPRCQPSSRFERLPSETLHQIAASLSAPHYQVLQMTSPYIYLTIPRPSFSRYEWQKAQRDYDRLITPLRHGRHLYERRYSLFCNGAHHQGLLLSDAFADWIRVHNVGFRLCIACEVEYSHHNFRVSRLVARAARVGMYASR